MRNTIVISSDRYGVRVRLFTLFIALMCINYE